MKKLDDLSAEARLGLIEVGILGEVERRWRVMPAWKLALWYIVPVLIALIVWLVWRQFSV